MAAIASSYVENAMDRTWYLSNNFESVCPGHCDPAYALDQDGTWSCNCGTWHPVAEPPKLLFPSVQAYSGQRLWGDIWQDEQDAEFARLSAHDQRMRMLLEASKAREAAVAMARAAAESEVLKERSIVCDRQGKLKPQAQVMRLCRDANAPAVFIGSDKRKYASVEDMPRGVSVYRAWKAGCELHAKGCCKFLHPGQEGFAEFMAGTPVQGKALPVGAPINFAALAQQQQQQQQRPNSGRRW